jgi:polyhydroxyalkanoate synthase
MSTDNTAANKLRQELNEFRERAGRALDALAGMGDVAIGLTPKDLIYSEDKLKLYRYRPLQDSSTDPSGAKQKVHKTRKATDPRPAVLICYALVNRPYMMDLQEDRSVIRQLLKRGADVFLIDWGYPDGADRYLTIDDYVNRYILHCVQAVCRVRDIDKVNLLGVCQGGTLSLCFAALHPEYVNSLITMVTPVDFQTEKDTLSKWSQALDVDAMVDTLGNVPGEVLNGAFLGLMPFRLTSQKYVDLLDAAASPAQLENFVRMEKWIFDSPDQPGAMFKQFVQWCYKENRLKAGTLELGGKRVDLKRIKVPVLNVYALQDHLVPPAASSCLKQLLGSKDYQELALNTGHIGTYVSAKSQTEMPDKLVAWLRERQ